MLQPRDFPGLPGDWESEWETFPAAPEPDSAGSPQQLFAVTHHAKDWKSPKALVVIHGQGEHGGRYLHFPHYLKGAVDAVCCLDLRGHGRSEGLRGHTPAFDLYARDVMIAIRRLDEKLKKRFGRSEIHLFGHSMGGLIVLRTAFLESGLSIHSVTASSPLLGIKVEVPAAKRAAGHVLSRLWGTLQMTNGIPAGDLSHDPAVVEAYRADRLNHNKVTPKFFTGLLTALADTNRRDSGFNYPLLMVVPQQDKIVDPEAELRFYRELKHPDKQLKAYPTFFHESFNEIGKEKAFEDLKSWLTIHSA